MSEDKVYAEQMFSLIRGYALYEPDPKSCHFDKVRIGDVGYIQDGAFNRLFNVCYDADDSINEEGIPDDFEALRMTKKDLRHRTRIPAGLMSSKSVTRIGGNLGLSTSWVFISEFFSSMTKSLCRTGGLQAGASFEISCSHERGAALIIKNEAFRQDASKGFQHELGNMMKRNYVQWHSFAKSKCGSQFELSELVLVTGCDLTKEWTTATFNEEKTEFNATFTVQAPPVTITGGLWGEWESSVHFPRRSGPGLLQPISRPSSPSLSSSTPLPPPTSSPPSPPSSFLSRVWSRQPQSLPTPSPSPSPSSSSPSSASKLAQFDVPLAKDYNQCIFIRGYRIFLRFRQIVKLRAAAEAQRLPGDYEPPHENATLCEDESDEVEIMDICPEEVVSSQIFDPYESLAQQIFEV